MNWNHLMIFYAVSEEGSVSRGADRLFISQPAVSKQIKILEHSLGVTLFDRLPRGLRLTEAGEILARYTRRLIGLESEAERAIAEWKGLKRGRLAIGASATIAVYHLPEILAKFRKKYPDIDLTLEIANTKTIQSQLLESQLDVGLTEGYAEQEHLISSVFMRDRLVAITSSDHSFASRTAITAKEFCAEPFLLREPGSGTRAVVERSLAEIGITLTPTLSLGSTEAIKRAVEVGMGVALISSLSIQQEVEAGRISVVSISDLTIERPLHLLMLRGRVSGMACRAFLQELAINESMI